MPATSHDIDARLEPFRRDCLRPMSLRYAAWLAVSLGLAYAVYAGWKDRGMEGLRPGLLVYYLVVGVHVAHRLRASPRRNVFAPDVIFLVFYTLFHLGYVTLFDLGLVGRRREVFMFEAAIPHSLFVVNIGVVSFLLGFEALGPWRRASAALPPALRPTRAWERAGVALMVVAAALHVGVLLTLTDGYFDRYGHLGIQRMGRYASYGKALVFFLANTALVVGVLLHTLASAFRHGALFRSRLALAITCGAFLVFMLEGDRAPILALGLPLLVVRHYFIRPLSPAFLIATAVAMLIVFSGLRAVRSTVLSPSAMLDEYQELSGSEETSWKAGIVEMGQSFQVVVITTHEVPLREPHWEGGSWFAAALHAFPFVQGAAKSSGWIRDQAPSEWITRTYFGERAAGRAFTVAAEGYLNFGYAGTLLELLALGMFMRWFLVRFARHPSAAWALVCLGCFAQCILVVRSHLNVVTREIAIVLVLAVVLHAVLGNERARPAGGAP